MATGYTEPTTEPFDVEAVNAFTTANFGYPLLGYWTFFNKPDAGKILDVKAYLSIYYLQIHFF